MKSPINLGLANTWSKVEWQLHSPTKCSTDIWQTATFLKSANIPVLALSQQTVYMFNFGVNLNAGTWYTLRITLKNAMGSINNKITEPFAIWTPTSYADNKYGIILDDNRAIGSLVIMA